MATHGGIAHLFEKHNVTLIKELDIHRVFPKFARTNIFTEEEEREISCIADREKKSEAFIKILSTKKGIQPFRQFCTILEELNPSLLTKFLLESTEVEDEDKPSQALQLGLELALKDRDAVLRDKAKASEERDNALRQLQQVKTERDQAINSLENLTGKPAKLSNSNKFEDSSTLTKRSVSPAAKPVMETDGKVEELYSVPSTSRKTGDNVVWETHKIHLTKAPVFGFGIAVSGGVDSPHFANGDPSVAISDVLRAGPAEGKLQVNDRITSVNSYNLENVDHSRAIQVLRECGSSVHLVIRRRVVLANTLESDVPRLKVTLSKKSKKDDFGVILGCRFYIKDIPAHSLAALEGGLKVGDTVLKINNATTESLSLVEARKLIEKNSKDKLQLIVSKNISHKKQNSQPKDVPYQPPGYDTLRRRQDKDDINIYRPSVRSEDDIYKPESLPQSSAHHSLYSTAQPYDPAAYFYDDGPPRPPLPSGFHDGPARPPSPLGQSRINPEDHYKYGSGGYPVNDRLREYDIRQQFIEDDVFNNSHEERYVGKRHDIRPEPRVVTFRKDADVGLGLRLAGGNATGTFIASVQAGCAAEAQGLTEGDQLLKAWITDRGTKANERDITGMTREEAVGYLTNLQGEVTLIVQYKKEEYDRIMASHEAGDSFYIKTHFHYEGDAETGEHSFNIGDLFHIKDTLFRGVGGSWLAIKLDDKFQETKKGTLPNTHKAETICQHQHQQNNDKENFPNKGRGSLFRRKAARRAKSLGKDHWEELIFSGVHTKFSAYQRVVLREAGFVRPVVIFGSISDIGRERLLSKFPDRYEAPQIESSSEDSKRKSGIIKLGSIRDIITKRKHALIDITPHHVDKLNYAQYCPIVIFVKADNKQAIKDCRAKWKTSSKNPKKLFEHNEKLEKLYSHLFTGVISHNSSDNWFPKVCEMIENQSRQKIWMSEKKPEEDISDDFLFPMPNRMSYAGAPENELDLSRNYSDGTSREKGKLVRSSSDPSINTNDKIPGIPPYPTPPDYNRKGYDDRIPYNGDPQDYYRDDRGRPEDHYYPSYYAQSSPSYAHNRTNIDPYATITPSERLRHRSMDVGPTSNVYSQYNGVRLSSTDVYNRPEYSSVQKLSSPYSSPHSTQPQTNHKSGHTDSSSHSSDSYNRYVSSPSNKHDDSKLRDKFGSLPGRGDKGPTHDPYRFTRSTTNPVSSANVDKAKLSEISAKYRKEDPKISSPNASSSSKGPPPPVAPKTKREPPPVPVKNYSLKERGIAYEDEKSRNYENSNRSYNYMDSSYTSPNRSHYNGTDHLQNISENHFEGPYEYISLKSSNVRDLRQNGVQHDHHAYAPNQTNSYDNQIYATEYYSDNVFNRDQHKSFANQTYMDHREVDRIRSSKEQLGNNNEIYPVENGYTRPRTDDEQLEELNEFRHRAKSESKIKPPTTPLRSERYKSWDSDKHVREHFESYKKLITPGFYRKQLSQSYGDVRGGDRDNEEQKEAGAFKVYRKNQIMSTFGKKDISPAKEQQAPLREQNPPLKVVDMSDSYIFVPVPPPPPPIPEVKVNAPVVANMGSNKELSIKDGDSCEGTPCSSDSISTPDTVVEGMDFGREIDKNHTVVATARGSFDSKGGVLESKETGVSIVIPPGALPDGPKQEIYFKVCTDNSILPPLDKDKGETLLSPLVMCGPHGLEFNQPVELKLPHCAAVNPDSWSFALKSSDSPSGHPTQWQNMNLAGMDGVTQGHVGKTSVSVMVDHF